MMEDLIGYLGTAKYVGISECMTSDYVLIRMFTVLQIIIGFATISIAIIFYLCYLSGNNIMRLSVLILKDPWLVKLLALFLGCSALNQATSVLTLHHGVYNLQAFTLTLLAGISVHAMIRLCGIALDKSRSTSILAEVLDGWSGDVPNYGQEPIEGRHVVQQKPLPIKFEKE